MNNTIKLLSTVFLIQWTVETINPDTCQGDKAEFKKNTYGVVDIVHPSLKADHVAGNICSFEKRKMRKIFKDSEKVERFIKDAPDSVSEINVQSW